LEDMFIHFDTIYERDRQTETDAAWRHCAAIMEPEVRSSNEL